MIVEVKIPSPGESITEVEIANWLVEDGDMVEKDQEIAEIESDKATLPLIAEYGGKIQLVAPAEEAIKVGEIAAKIDTEAAGTGQAAASEKQEQEAGEATSAEPQEAENAGKETAPQAAEEKQPAPEDSKTTAQSEVSAEKYKDVKISPLADKLRQEHGLSIDDIVKGLERISRKDIEAVASLPQQKEAQEQQAAASRKEEAPAQEKAEEKQEGSRITKTSRMSNLRRKLSQRLVAVKNETAMLTTFNEVDMSEVIRLRSQYKKQFIDTHGNKLGFMSFFIKAATIALQEFPDVGAVIDGENIITHNYADVGIAVQTPKGLMVPVIRNAETQSLAQLEQMVMEMAQKAQNNRISIEEMSGGNFTITNGGTFGSMLSTPILNPPQSGILGMHNIKDRPVAVNGKAEVRPVMYLALSYDHRVIDGATSVRFLVKIKEMIENPTAMLLNGRSPEEQLLGL